MNIHSFYRSHIFENIKSRDTFPQRPVLTLDGEGRVVLGCREEVFPGYDFSSDVGFRSYCLHRLYDYDSALRVCEEQIEDMVREYPFSPEDFLFTVMSDDHAVDYTSYVYSYGDRTAIIARGVGAMMWILTVTIGGRVCFSGEVYFPNNNIAYHFFIAIGLIDINDELWKKRLEEKAI